MATDILDPNFLAIETIFRTSCFNVPIYQRPYSWEKEQVMVFLQDIDAQFRKDKNLEYYMGNMIIYDKGQKTNGVINNYDIIDGQQRTITFSLLFLCIYSVAHKLGIGDDAREIAMLKDILWHPINRKNDRSIRLVNIGSIEKECYEALYNFCYDSVVKEGETTEDVVEFCERRKAGASVFEKRVLENFLTIYNYILERYSGMIDSILDYADYVLNRIKLIQIEATCPEKDVFSMFESINSKGKQLEQIDLIKSYIFSNLDGADYDKCSKIWGRLTIETEDNLYNYLYIYIRAYIYYYRQKFNVNQFKSLCQNELLQYFGVSSTAVAIRKLLEELDAKLEKYKAVNKLEVAEKIFSGKKFKFFYMLFIKNGYEHPRALFFRLFNDFEEGKITQKEAVAIMIDTILMMYKFMTVLGKDSKDAIGAFYNMMQETHKNGRVSREVVKAEIDTLFKRQNITNETTINQLRTTDTYTNRVAVPLLAIYVSTEEKAEGEYYTSFDQAYWLCDTFAELYSLRWWRRGWTMMILRGIF